MTSVERRSVTEGQLLVLWTWLLEAYVPVPHMVADLDELEAFCHSTASDDARGRESHAVGALRGQAAA